MKEAVVDRAIKLAGGPTELARRLNIKAPSIHSWRKIPPKRVLTVAEITGIPPWELRPDLYPDPKTLIGAPLADPQIQIEGELA